MGRIKERPDIPYFHFCFHGEVDRAAVADTLRSYAANGSRGERIRGKRVMVEWSYDPLRPFPAPSAWQSASGPFLPDDPIDDWNRRGTGPNAGKWTYGGRFTVDVDG